MICFRKNLKLTAVLLTLIDSQGSHTSDTGEGVNDFAQDNINLFAKAQLLSAMPSELEELFQKSYNHLVTLCTPGAYDYNPLKPCEGFQAEVRGHSLVFVFLRDAEYGVGYLIRCTEGCFEKQKYFNLMNSTQFSIKHTALTDNLLAIFAKEVSDIREDLRKEWFNKEK